MSLGDVLAFPIALSGVPFLIRRALFKHAVTILVYHDPSVECFETHLEWLVNHYSIVPIDEAAGALQQNDLASLGDYPLLITIDDGRKGNYELLSVLKKYSVRPCFYICSSVVGTDRKLWDDFIVENMPHELMRLKKMTELERRKYLSAHCGVEYEGGGEGRSMLSADEISEMLPYVDFGSHGRFHQPFSSLTDIELRNEAVCSKLEIEQLTGKPCVHFSFPSGMYDERCEQVLRETGYISVRTTDCGRNCSTINIYSMRVCSISDGGSLAKLNVQSSGLFGFLRDSLLSSRAVTI